MIWIKILEISIIKNMIQLKLIKRDHHSKYILNLKLKGDELLKIALCDNNQREMGKIENLYIYTLLKNMNLIFIVAVKS